MDKRVLRERMRKKQQQIRRRQMMKKGAYVVAVILVFIFVIRGIILPVINRVGGKNTDKPAQVQAETDTNAEPHRICSKARLFGSHLKQVLMGIFFLSFFEFLRSFFLCI